MKGKSWKRWESFTRKRGGVAERERYGKEGESRVKVGTEKKMVLLQYVDE